MIDALTVWDELRRTEPGRPGMLRRRVLPASSRDIYLAVTQPSGDPLLILGLTAAPATATQLPSTRAVRTSFVELDSGGGELRMTLVTPDAVRVFAPFVEDVAAHVSEETDDDAVITAFLARFAHWKRLLAGLPTDGLSSDTAQGLWGELWVLRRVLHPLWHDDAVVAWTGAESDNKDFRRHNIAVEVKTTRATSPLRVRINGERQLEIDPQSDLHLAVLEVDVLTAGTSGETLVDAIEATRQLLSPGVRHVLDEKLNAYGFDDADAEAYRSVRYLLHRVLWHRVTHGFPRLTRTDLIDGVGSVTYLLSVDACAPWKLAEAEIAERLSGQGGGV